MERWLVIQLAVNRWRSAVEFPWNQTRVPLASYPHVNHIICSHTMSAADIQLSDRWAWSRYSPVIQTTLAPRRLEGQTPLLLLPPQTSQGETIYSRKRNNLSDLDPTTFRGAVVTLFIAPLYTFRLGNQTLAGCHCLFVLNWYKAPRNVSRRV